MTNEKGLFLQPTFFPLVEYGKQRGNTALDVWVSAPTYRIPNRPRPAAYLDVSATYRPATREIFLNVLNRSRDREIAASIENQEGRLDGQVGVWELNHPDLKATHTFGDDRKVRPATRTITLTPGADGRVVYAFPAHSLSILRLKLR
jgi:alpha-L-arabinofuranosidase